MKQAAITQATNRYQQEERREEVKEVRTTSESNSITFEFESANASSEARLTMRLSDGSFRTTYSRAAEKRWKEIEHVSDEFPGPQIEAELMQRLC